ncbi:MAG: transglycosylase SLT domain-containing protein [Mycobacteriaceae bacterium]|nr:transglycosylase SLT domain-containing protein [Mycobacteriaceae bacterium]
MDAVIEDTHTGVATIALRTDTPAGRQQLVDHLQTQLQRAKALLQISEQRNMALAQMIRTAAAGYRNSPGVAASMSSMPTMSSPAVPPSIGSSAAAAPALTRLISLTHHRLGARLAADAQRPGLTLHNPVVAQTPGAEHVRAAIRAALDIKGITNPVARAHWEAGMMTVADRESGFNPNAVNRYDENARQGNPSEGAFQMIGTTFRAYHEPGTPSNNHDLVAQAAAFINYVQDRYGVVSNGSNLEALVQQADPTRPPKGY